MNKHYIRLDKNKNIIKTYTDAFEDPEGNDLCIYENEERHFNMDLVTSDGYYKYKYMDSQIIEKSNEEIYTKKVLKEIADREKEQKNEKLITKKIREIAIEALKNDGEWLE